MGGQVDLRQESFMLNVAEAPSGGVWSMTLGPSKPFHKSATHHRMVCTAPDTVTLNDTDAALETTLWTTVAECRKAMQDENGVRRVLLAVNDGRAATQSVPQVHVHVIGVDFLKSAFSQVVRRDLPRRDTPRTNDNSRSLVSTFGTAACFKEASSAAAGPHHLVVTGDPAHEADMWALQRQARNLVRIWMGKDTNFSIFMESGVSQSPEINIIPRVQGLHHERGLTDIVRRHFWGLPYAFQTPVKNFLRQHGDLARGVMALRRLIYNP